MGKRDSYRLKVVVERDGQFGTVFWATWKDGHVYYGTGHAHHDGQYLKASYHRDGRQHTYALGTTPDHREVHPQVVPPGDLEGTVKRWTKILTPDLHDVSWRPEPPQQSDRLAVTTIAAERLSNWPLACLNFWLIEKGRQDLVQELLNRSYWRGIYALMDATDPQMLAFFTAPDEIELSGIKSAMGQGPG